MPPQSDGLRLDYAPQQRLRRPSSDRIFQGIIESVFAMIFIVLAGFMVMVTIFGDAAGPAFRYTCGFLSLIGFGAAAVFIARAIEKFKPRPPI